MEKFTKPELLNFLCEGASGEGDDVLTSFEDPKTDDPIIKF